MSIAQSISDFFEEYYPHNDAGLDELSSAFTSRVIPKGTTIIRASTTDDKLRFLNKGTVREYYLSDAKEININFYVQQQFITDLSSFMNAAKTKKNQESLSEIEIFELGRKPFLKLLDKYECGQDLIDQFFQKLLVAHEKFEYNRMTKTPEELYTELRIYKPEWLQKIPQYHIASYLGITPETLSRIRNRIS